MIIVDGYNLLFHRMWTPVGNSLQKQRQHLIDSLVQYKHISSSKKFVIVFDGQSEEGSCGSLYHRGIDIVYAHKADDKIVELVQEIYKAKVITADRQLSERVKREHGIVISPEEFLQEWRKWKEISYSKELSKHELSYCTNIEEWLEAFGLESEIEIPKEIS